MYEYKEGDIVKIINGEGSDLGTFLNGEEIILCEQESRDHLGDNSKYNKSLMFKYNSIDLEDRLYFRDEDVELVGWTYIPDYELIKDREFKVIETNLGERYIPASYVNNENYKQRIIEDSTGYYIDYRGGNSISLHTFRNKEFDFDFEIRLDNTIKIFNKKPQVNITKNIEEYIAIFTNYFEDSCEVKKINDTEYEFIIWFPELTIINELNKSHPIKDLYVLFNLKLLKDRFVFQRENSSNYYLGGCRGTITDREYAVFYQHSHLPSGYSIEKFCLGTGPILTNIAAFNMENDSLLFEKIMLDIIDYVKVESIEGTPHIRFETVYSKKVARFSTISLEERKQEYSNFLYHYTNVPVSINDNLEITVDERNPLFIEQVSAITNFINGQEPKIIIRNEDKNRLMLTFKNEKIKLKIIKTEKDEENKEQLQRTADERITSYIAKRLSKELTAKILANVNRESRTGYFTGIMAEDTSVAPEHREAGMVRSVVSKSGRRLVKL